MAKNDDDKQTNTLAGLSEDSVVPAVGSPEQKEANKEAVNAANGGSNVSDDFFTNPDVKAATQTPTALDHQGNERIIGVTGDNWSLPPSELSSDEIAAAEKREKAEEEARKIRLSGGAAAQSLKSDESGAANASQGVGGSS